MKTKIRHSIGKKAMPFFLAVVMAATTMPVYMNQTAIVKAATSVTFGTSHTKLATGTYTVPVSLKNASNIEKDSMAASAIGENGILTVSEDGKATIEIELKEINKWGITGAASDIEIYQGNDTKSEKKAADVIHTDQTTGNPTKIKFEIPETTKTADGVYLNMKVKDTPMANGTDAFLKIDYASLAGNTSTSDGTKENKIHISQFGGYDIKTIVTYKDGKVTDLMIAGENFEGSYAKQNEKTYLPMAIDKIKEQIIGLDITDQNAFDQVDTVSGATTSATAIKNAVMESVGLTIKQEVLAPAPETISAGTYEIKVKNATDTVEHSLSAANSENKVTATLNVDQNGKMTLSYPIVSTEALNVLAFNGYYNGSDLTTDHSETSKDADGNIANVSMPLESKTPELTYKANFKVYVPAMKNLTGTIHGITFDQGKFDTDTTLTLYWDTLKEKKEGLSDGIYKVDAKMLKTNGKDESMANDAIVHKAKLTVKDGKYYVTLNFKALNIPLSGQTFHGYLNKIQYLENGEAKDVTVDQVQKNTNGEVVTDELGTNYPDIVTFPITEEVMETGIVPMQVFVPMMDSIMPGMGTQKMNLSLDLSSLVKTTVDDKDFNNGDVIEEAAKKEENKKPEQTPVTPSTSAPSTTTAQKPAQTTTVTKLAKVNGVKVKNSSKKTATVSWKKVKGATGYVVYRSTKKNGKYKAVKTITKGSTTKYVNKKLKKKKTYYYKVRAVKKSGNKKIYSAYSKVVSVKIKK